MAAASWTYSRIFCFCRYLKIIVAHSSEERKAVSVGSMGHASAFLQHAAVHRAVGCGWGSGGGNGGPFLLLGRGHKGPSDGARFYVSKISVRSYEILIEPMLYPSFLD